MISCPWYEVKHPVPVYKLSGALALSIYLLEHCKLQFSYDCKVDKYLVYRGNSFSPCEAQELPRYVLRNTEQLLREEANLHPHTEKLPVTITSLAYLEELTGWLKVRCPDVPAHYA